MAQRYLNRFQDASAYEAFMQSAEFVTPSVSYCIEEGEVHFNPIQRHEYVDLGLPSGTLWASENIKDANGNDLYFAWGETSGYTVEQLGTDKYFSWEDYKFGTEDNLTKYNASDEKTALDMTDDAATANWGSGWRMPTDEQFDELIANTEYEWTMVNGVQGAKFTSIVEGYTDKFLFFPAIGGADYDVVHDVGMIGDYWSASLGDKGGVTSAWKLNIGSSFPGVNNNIRYNGCSVRPVCAEL